MSIKFIQFLFPKKNYEILNALSKSINVYILFKTFIKSGVINFSDNYKKNFIELVSPKIVITAIDNNPVFYKLKNIYNKPNYISIQNGMRKDTFYKECKKYINKTGQKLKADHIFLFGVNEKKRFSKIIDSNFHCIGNLVNNHYPIRYKNIKKKINSIMYISQYKISIHENPNSPLNTFEEDKRIFNQLVKFCKKNKINLSFAANDRSNKPGLSLESYYRKNLINDKWIYHRQGNKLKTYSNLNKQQMVVFGYSTLGYEALAKGLKCVSCYKHFPIIGSNVKYVKSGSFWTSSKKYSDLEKTLNRVIKLSSKQWKKIAGKYSKEILDYDPNNIEIKKILKRILLKK